MKAPTEDLREDRTSEKAEPGNPTPKDEGHASFGKAASHHLIYDGSSPERLDRFLCQRLPVYSRSQIKRLISQGHVWIEGRKGKASTLLRGGERISVSIPESPPPVALPEEIPLTILHEDPWILVVNKPAGMVVHPAPGHRSGTLVNALLAHCPTISSVGGTQRSGLVHRLDKGTSGVIVVAKTDEAHRSLTRQFHHRLVRKEYLALVWGRVSLQEGVVDFPIGRHIRDRKRISARTRKPRDAKTRWEVVRHFEDVTLLRVLPETGRTHQIRVHLSAVHHPIVGDPLYGKGRHRCRGLDTNLRTVLSRLSRPFLHAWRLTLMHPHHGKMDVFEAPLPPDLLEILRLLGYEDAGERFDRGKRSWI